MSDASTLEARAPAPASAAEVEAPIGLLAEITHRCPLQCPYCSNPVELERPAGELSTAEWARVFREAAAMGVLQLHVSGGEPLARADAAEIVRAAREAGLYVNLITAAVTLSVRARGRPGGGRHRPRADLAPGRRRGRLRTHHSLAQGVFPQDRGGGALRRARRADHAQRRGPPAQPRPGGPHDRRGPGGRRGAHRDRPRPVLRLGAAATARRLDADPRAGGPRHGGRGGGARAARGPAPDRLRGARLPRGAAEALHGRLGARVPGRHALGGGDALPRRGHHPRPAVRHRARAGRSRRSGAVRTPSSASAARAGCASPAAPATGARRIGAAAAARR